MKETSQGSGRHGRHGSAARRAALLAAALTLLLAAAAGAAAAAQAAGYNLYFGDLHSHTDYSDGMGTPTDAYSAAFEAAKAGEIDFFGTTDHNHYGWGTGWMTADNWADTLAVADAFNHDGLLVTFPGYELWLPSIGEMNVFNTTEWFNQRFNPARRGLNNGVRGAVKVVPRLYDWLAARGASAQWNHPALYGAQGGPLVNFYGFGYRTPERDQAVNMIEVWNEEVYEWAYIEALDAGWHVLPSANSDTHEANWVTGCDVRTVLLAEELTRAALLDAMRASRGYATEDKNLEVRYELDGRVMGSTLTPKKSYKATISVKDPDGAADAVKLIEIVADGGKVVASKAFDAADVSWTPTVPSSDERYFWVRVTTASDFWGDQGVTAWTAPVWTGR